LLYEMRVPPPLTALVAIIGQIVDATQIAVETPLGIVLGSDSDKRFLNVPVGVESFLGLKYASVPRRFAKSQLPGENSNAIVDATEFGPYC
jgi:hypothetical protein